ncbi:nucleotide sugar dehydrogenase [Paracoccaceae bacterium]|nr:nucleotide sugar dehydrogenase [Paracoccaceae bacterium]
MRFNIDFACGYSPERVNPGDKVNTLTTIKKITSGSNAVAADEIDVLYGSIITAGTWKASSLKVAEAAKVIENSQRDLNIAFVNELSVIFDRLGIDTLEVLEAAGSKWNFLPFRPGMVGGHCIGVDPYYLTHKAEEVGYNPQVVLAGRRINDNMAKYAAKSIVKRMLQNGVDVARSKVGVLGLTFKENCPDIRNSKVVDLIRELESWNVTVSVSDPWANSDEVMHEYAIELVDTSKMQGLSAVIVAVGHNEFREMDVSVFPKWCAANGAVFGDLKAIYDKQLLCDAGFDVFRL